jgi:UDP-N-acetylglucosamine--N-acetylmuramyl-(pentapeptide) pyrophosphoryl-undecaprenol N-acetylglucosamine transferase
MVNARQLEIMNAALIVKDSEAMKKLVFMIKELSMDESKQNEMRKNISALAIKDADKKIAEEILKNIS